MEADTMTTGNGVEAVPKDTVESEWPEGYWEQIYGCLDDSSFVEPEELEFEDE